MSRRHANRRTCRYVVRRRVGARVYEAEGEARGEAKAVWALTRAPRPRWSAGVPAGVVKRCDLAGSPATGTAPRIPPVARGPRPHLITTVHGLPVSFALTSARTDEREILLDQFDLDAALRLRPLTAWNGSSRSATGLGAALRRAGRPLVPSHVSVPATPQSVAAAADGLSRWAAWDRARTASIVSTSAADLSSR